MLLVVEGIMGSKLRQTHQGNCRHSIKREHHIGLGSTEGSPGGGTEVGGGCVFGPAWTSVMHCNMLTKKHLVPTLQVNISKTSTPSFPPFSTRISPIRNARLQPSPGCLLMSYLS